MLCLDKQSSQGTGLALPPMRLLKTTDESRGPYVNQLAIHSKGTYLLDLFGSAARLKGGSDALKSYVWILMAPFLGNSHLETNSPLRDSSLPRT